MRHFGAVDAERADANRGGPEGAWAGRIDAGVDRRAVERRSIGARRIFHIAARGIDGRSFRGRIDRVAFARQVSEAGDEPAARRRRRQSNAENEGLRALPHG